MATETLAEGQHLRLLRNDRGWEFAQRVGVSGVVVVVALTDAGELLLVEQHRAPIGTAVIELPAGLAGDIAGSEDEDLAVAAIRELEEETGYTASGMQLLTSGPVSAGMTDETLSFFKATGVRRIGPGGGDDSEDIVVHAIPLAQVAEWLAERAAAGVPCDPKVYAGLWFASA
jgi:ADP-ribose pyrophosphatase